MMRMRFDLGKPYVVQLPSEMAETFNVLQDEIARSADGLDHAREGLREARDALTDTNRNLEQRVEELAAALLERQQGEIQLRQAKEAAEEKIAAAKRVEAAKAEAEQKAAAKAAKAPDKKKLTTLAESLLAVEIPVMATPDGRLMAKDAARMIRETSAAIKAMAEKHL